MRRIAYPSEDRYQSRLAQQRVQTDALPVLNAMTGRYAVS